MFQRFNQRAREAIERAAEKAKQLGNPTVLPEHLLASLAEVGESSFSSLLSTFAVPIESVSEAVPLLEQAPGAEASASDTEEPQFSEDVKRVLEYAVEEADRLGHKRIGTSHFMLGLIRDELQRDKGLQVLTSLGLSLEDVRERVRELGAHEGAGREDVVPAILFFELDRRARDAEKALGQRIDKLEEELRASRALVDLLSERLARLEAERERWASHLGSEGSPRRR